MSTDPALWDGVVAVITVWLLAVPGTSASLGGVPNLTLMLLPKSSPGPAMVTAVPPAVGPELGDMEMTPTGGEGLLRQPINPSNATIPNSSTGVRKRKASVMVALRRAWTVIQLRRGPVRWQFRWPHPERRCVPWWGTGAPRRRRRFSAVRPR